MDGGEALTPPLLPPVRLESVLLLNITNITNIANIANIINITISRSINRNSSITMVVWIPVCKKEKTITVSLKIRVKVSIQAKRACIA